MTTQKSPEEVFQAVEYSLRNTVGGRIEREGNIFTIYDGKRNLDFCYVADITATVTLLQSAPDTIDLNGEIMMEPNQLFFVFGVVSLFCLYFMLIFDVLYFVVNPTRNYQLALDRVDPDQNFTAYPPPFGL